MHLVDHVFVLILAIVYPIYGAVSFRKYVREIKAGKTAEPVKLYRESMMYEWIALAVLATAWFVLRRPAADLGFVAPGGPGLYVAIALLALGCGFLLVSWRSVKGMTEEKRARQVEALGDLEHFLPRNQNELRSFNALSVTAGIVEEIIYRGFVIWYLSHFLPLWGAVIVSSLVFGLGHSYQGIAGILRTGLVGFGFAVLYVVSGSIWIPMIGHVLFDILQGKTIIEVFRDA